PQSEVRLLGDCGGAEGGTDGGAGIKIGGGGAAGGAGVAQEPLYPEHSREKPQWQDGRGDAVVAQRGFCDPHMQEPLLREAVSSYQLVSKTPGYYWPTSLHRDSYTSRGTR